jgi:HAD superfamily hydrolase (TIGR01509 family)
MTDTGVLAVGGGLDPAAVRMLLCDADGNLFPSEEPAFVASTRVVNRVMERLGSDRRYDPEKLRLATLGRTFRSVIAGLAADAGSPAAAEQVEAWVEEERREVTAYLREALEPDPEVVEPLRRLAETLELAVVSSSALERLDACFEVTGLAGLLPAERRFSAEDSLAEPTSKPDPAIYAFAGRELGVAGAEAVAVEDSPTGVASAVAAGFPVIGNVQFVAPAEREQRIDDLLTAGASAVVSAWTGVEALLQDGRGPSPGGPSAAMASGGGA